MSFGKWNKMVGDSLDSMGINYLKESKLPILKKKIKYQLLRNLDLEKLITIIIFGLLVMWGFFKIKN